MFRSSSIRSIALACLAVQLSAAVAFAQVDLQQKLASQSTQVARPHSDALAGLHAGPAALPENFEMLTLAPGFLISVNVAEDSDFSGSFRVDHRGDINIPQLGPLHVAGETSGETRAAIRQKLIDGGYLRNPLVEVDVLEYTAPRVTIMGEVAAPGEYPLLAPQKLIDVLAMAGGTTLLAGNEITITHKGDKTAAATLPYSKQANNTVVGKTLVQPGDTIDVRRAGVVFVLGAVNRPGGYVMQESGDLSVLQAIALASGTSLIASTHSIDVLRKVPDGSVVEMQLPYSKMAKGRLADIQLRPDDIVFVPTNKFKSTFTSTQGILAAAASASIYAATIY